MNFSILESTKNLFNKDFINKTAGILGEEKESVSQGIQSIIPTTLTTFIQKISNNDSQPEVEKHIEDAKQNKFHSSLQKIITGKDYEKYEHLFDSAEWFFGNKLNDVSGEVAKKSGLSETSANWLIRLATPTLLGNLGEQLQKQKLPLSQASQLIQLDKDNIFNAISSQPELVKTLGIDSVQDFSKQFSDKFPDITSIGDGLQAKKEQIATAVESNIDNLKNLNKPVQEKAKEVSKKMAEPRPTVAVQGTSSNSKLQILSWVLLAIFFVILIVILENIPEKFKIFE